MRESSKPRTGWIAGVLLQVLLLTSLSGCASNPLVVPQEKAAVPAEWSRPQLPDVNAFSEKAQSFLQRVQTYFEETPQFTTPSQQP